MSHPLCLMTLTMRTTGVHYAPVNTYPTYRALFRRRPLKIFSIILDSLLLQYLRECHMHHLWIDDANLI